MKNKNNIKQSFNFLPSNKKCVICNFKYINMHHIIPVINFGSNDETNLICLCPNHHYIIHKGTEKEKNTLSKLIKKRTNKIGSTISDEEKQKILNLVEEEFKKSLVKCFSLKYSKRFNQEDIEKFRRIFNFKQAIQKILGEQNGRRASK